MTFRRPQLRLRSLLVVIIVLAGFLGFTREAIREWRLAETYRKVAARLTKSEDLTRERFESNEKILKIVGARMRSFESVRNGSEDTEERRRSLEQLKTNHARLSAFNEEVGVRYRYYSDLRRKYDRAASHPWLPVAPDPPPPGPMHFFPR